MGYKTESTKQDKQKKHRQTTVWWSPEGRRGGGLVRGKGGQIYAARRFDFGC